MMPSNDNRVSIHVNVIVDGVRLSHQDEHGAALVRPGSRLGSLEIRVPPSSTATNPANTPVTRIAGQNFIAADGTSPYLITYSVWGLAYDNISPAIPASPVGTAAVQGTLAVDGSWQFTAANNNLVPGAACDNIDGGPDNSTLVIWYQHGLLGRWGIDQGTFHGYCPGGSGSSHSVVAIPAHPRIQARTLHAGFTRGLARLGNVPLQWNGVSWVGQTAEHGGCIVSFQCNDSACQLQACGPAAAFIAAGRPGSFKPFHWSATGIALGALAGDFAVQITE